MGFLVRERARSGRTWIRASVCLVGVVALATSCGGSGSVIATDQGPEETVVPPDAADKDARTPVDMLGDSTSDLRFDWGQDDAVEAQAPGCESGSGCFGDPCTENAECESGFCIEHMGGGTCTIACQEECPPGYACKQSGEGPDLVFLCVSNFANLCKPCADNGDCTSLGADDVCVSYGEEGSFCGGNCKAHADCPWGFSCVDAVTVSGLETKQCVADTGLCPCTPKSVRMGLLTPCARTNEWGTCPGKRTCLEGGLSQCDAVEPAEEGCNGLDDDCDGEVDEPALVDGKYVDLCFDGNDCTEDLCKGTDGCEHVALDGTECKDGDLCTVADQCQAGACLGSPVKCNDSNPCTDDSCDGAGGCIYAPNSLDCDDGDPCTVADQCKQGSCVGFAVACDCQQDSDCGQLEDGDSCNGTLYCRTDKLPYQCVVDPATVISCPLPTGLDAPCLANVCEPSTGKCSFAPANENGLCDDGNACTLGERCGQGVCTGGKTANCNDGNPCTIDSCAPETGCQNGPAEGPCNDGNPCTTQDSCLDGACTGGLPPDCDDGNPCTDEACSPENGCYSIPNSLPCDDGNACTLDDLCVGGGCSGGDIVACNDKNPCTADSCHPLSGCIFSATSSPCSDGNPCTLNDSCSKGVCQPGPLVDCDDGNACTKDSCGANGLCLHEPVDGGCDDGNSCTGDDSCSKGKCLGTTPVDCDDGNVCTKEVCDPVKGCVYTPAANLCDDGNSCTLTDKCQGGLCTAGSPLDCNDGSPCTADSCDPAAGCVHAPAEGACEDGNPCTVNDTCLAGVCTAGAPKPCDEGNACTADSCDPATGCVHTPKEGPCDDSNACTQGETCQGGTCQGGLSLTCDDGKPCTSDSCEPATGCKHTPTVPCCGNLIVEAGEVCDDGNQVGGDGCEATCKAFSSLSVSFSTCGQTGNTGPSQGQCDSAYGGKPGLAGKVTVTDGIQYWVAPYPGKYRITAAGAAGFAASASGGYGAVMRGDVTLLAGQKLKILVGQQGGTILTYGGGGGGTFVATDANVPLVVAGGGGFDNRYGVCATQHGTTDTLANGSCNCQVPYVGGANGNGGEGGSGGGGGGGFNGNGGDPTGGLAFVNGGVGGTSPNQGYGGFGGGGGTSDDQAAGGGGYSGGGGCGEDGQGGGGGSYNSGANPQNQSGQNSGHGYVQIDFLG